MESRQHRLELSSKLERATTFIGITNPESVHVDQLVSKIEVIFGILLKVLDV